MLFQRTGQLLAAAGYISDPQLQSAKAAYDADPGTDLPTLFARFGSASRTQICQLLEQQWGILCPEPDWWELSPDLARLIPRATAATYRVVPVRQMPDKLYLAMADPLDLTAAEAVRSLVRRNIIPVLASPTEIQQAIARLYGRDSAAQAIRDLHTEAAPEAPSPATAESQAPAVRLVNSFLEFAFSRHASDIHLEPREGEMAVRMRIDGILHQTFSVPKASQRAVIARIKVMGNMDLAEHQMPLDGRCSMAFGEETVDLRISTLPTIHGEKVVIRLLHRDPKLLTPGGIGLSGNQLTLFQNLLRNTGGVILIAGPTGSGKSSTLYTMLSQLNQAHANLISLEDPVEYRFNRINQVQINEQTGMTFAAALRSVLRQDPDIIAVGEIRDAETAQIAMRAAITGHLVLSTIHAGDAPAALDRLLDMGIAPYLLSAGLRGILSQRLVRKLCPHCLGSGCSRCFHTGYLGRTAIFEILPITAQIRRAISEQHSRELREDAIRQSGFSPMADHARELIRQGITSQEECLRTLGDLSPERSSL